MQHMRSARHAFTLIELMVVIGIISILSGVLVFSIASAMSSAREGETSTNIQNLGQKIQKFETRWRFFPPSTIAELSRYLLSSSGGSGFDTDPNMENTGIETLVMALRTRREGGPFIDNDFLSKYQSNIDEDEVVTNFANVDGSLKLFEIMDGWENPLVYVNLNDLDPRGTKINAPFAVTTKNGVQQVDLNVLAQMLRDPKLDVVVPKGWVVWSFGPDGINDYGRGDDITSWPKILE